MRYFWLLRDKKGTKAVLLQDSYKQTAVKLDVLVRMRGERNERGERMR
jgi:hypothetical protein